MAEKKYLFNPSEGAYSYGDVHQSGSQPNPDHEKEHHYCILCPSPETTVANKEAVSPVLDADKSKCNRDEKTSETAVWAAADFNYKYEQLSVSERSIWAPNLFECNTLPYLKNASQSSSDSQCQIFYESFQLDRANVYEPSSTSISSENSIIGKPASATTAIVMTTTVTSATVSTDTITKAPVTATVTTATVTETTVTTAITRSATSSPTSYAEVTTLYIPPESLEFPKYINQPLIKSQTKYTIFVECLPNWTVHLRQLTLKLGQTPNTRSYGKGVQFMPKTSKDYILVKDYLTNLLETEPDMSWFSYTPSNVLPTKVSVMGLPYGIPTIQLKEALKEHGFPVELVQFIPMRGRAKCIYAVEFGQLPRKQFTRTFSIHDLLHMSGVIIENWNKTKPVQTQYHNTFEKEISSQNTMENERGKELSERKQKIEARQQKTNEDNKINEEGEGWTTVCRRKKHTFSPLSVPTKSVKKPVEGLMKINRYDIGAITDANASEPTVCNKPVSEIKTKSKKKREKRKLRREWFDLYTSSATLNTEAEVAASENDAISVEVNEDQNPIVDVDPPSQLRGCSPLQQSTPDTTNTRNERQDHFNDVLRKIAKIAAEILEALNQCKEVLEYVHDAINIFLDENDEQITPF